VNGYPRVADWHADVNLAVVGVLVDVQTVMQDQLSKLSSVQKVQQRPSTEPCGTPKGSDCLLDS